MFLRTVGIIAAIGLLSACGGSGSSNGAPSLKTFTYGTPAAPTTTQKAAATSAQTSLQSISTGAKAGQAAQTAAAPQLTDSLGYSALAGLTSEEQPGADALRSTQDRLAALVVRAASRPSTSDLALGTACATVTPTSVTYSNCTSSEAGYALTLNGSITLSGNTVTWNITATTSGSSGSTSFIFNVSWSGTLTVTASTIVGNGRSSWWGTYASGGTSVSYAYTVGIDLDLTYATSPYCITAGTLEVRRVVSWSGSGSPPLTDKAVKFTWSGCGSYTVAIGT